MLPEISNQTSQYVSDVRPHTSILPALCHRLLRLLTVDEAEETGWKFVHADVFRFPAHPNLFAAVIGSGTQILVMTFVIFGLALVRLDLPQRYTALASVCRMHGLPLCQSSCLP
jgi:hypothetical protein